MKKLRIIVGGFIGLMPAGGVTWDYIQYPLGFSLLGHDVYYLEDTRLFPIYQKPGTNWDDCGPTVTHISEVMDYFGLSERWAYIDEASGQCFGISRNRLMEICNSADLFINISCSTWMREEYLNIPVRILIDSDPMFTQIQYLSGQTFTPGTSTLKQLIDAHNYHFTFGEKIGSPDCLIPLCGIDWQKTRQPVCLKFWKQFPLPAAEPVFTTLMNWSAGKKLYFNNDTWGQKDIEFTKFLTLPELVPDVKLSMVVSQTGGTEKTLMEKELPAYGWQILTPETHASDWIEYQAFISQSTGEFSVAKETYVKARTGWFSCRSACYLASGRPVITQDTGWSEILPNGRGLFSFKNIDEAGMAFSSVLENPHQHANYARAIAEEFFDSAKVLNNLLLKI